MRARIVVIFWLSLFLGQISLQAGDPMRILGMTDRSELLSFAKTHTELEDRWSDEVLNEIDDPFSIEEETRVEVKEKESEDKVVAVTQAITTPEEILRGIVSDLKPTGSLSFGDKKALMFGKKFLREGDTMKAIYEGKEYDIRLISVSSRSYMLELNSFTLEQDFEKVSSGVIERVPVESIDK